VTVRNPILPGFRPDPSVIRVDADYLVATSTFEWFPGVELHRSHDLVHWELLAAPLQRPAQLDLHGDPDSGGVWAPCLSYDGVLFYLVYTDVKQHGTMMPDTHNYLVSAHDIAGPWSDPVYLNAYGADPSLFHDRDGRKWLTVTNAEFRPGYERFGGILLQEIDAHDLSPKGPARPIFAGTKLGYTEGPHLYYRDGYYYLLTAEGGTFYGHAVTLARSRSLQGPYELHPENPLLSSRDLADHPIQRAGHADLVEVPGEAGRASRWYMLHLMSRLLPSAARRSILGRETAIQEIVWHDDGWPRLRDAEGTQGACRPSVVVNLPEPAAAPPRTTTTGMRLDPDPAVPPGVGASGLRVFDAAVLPREFKSLRRPPDPGWCQPAAWEAARHAEGGADQPPCLRLFGGESPASLFRQSMIARRREHMRFFAWTLLHMTPQSPKHMAGLICYYNTRAYHYLAVSVDDAESPTLAIISRNGADAEFTTGPSTVGPEAIAEDAESLSDGTVPRVRLFLGIEGNAARLQFYAAPASPTTNQIPWHAVGPLITAEELSDEGVPGGGFTGTMIGMCCQDLSGAKGPADFLLFGYDSGGRKPGTREL